MGYKICKEDVPECNSLTSNLINSVNLTCTFECHTWNQCF